MSLRLVLPLSKAFSDSARAAALEARRAKMRGATEAPPVKTVVTIPEPETKGTPVSAGKEPPASRDNLTPREMVSYLHRELVRDRFKTGAKSSEAQALDVFSSALKTGNFTGRVKGSGLDLSEKKLGQAKDLSGEEDLSKLADSLEKLDKGLIKDRDDAEGYVVEEAVKHISSKEGQAAMVAMMQKAANEPGDPFFKRKLTALGAACIDVASSLRGDILDKLGDDPKLGPKFTLYSKDYPTFRKRFMDNWAIGSLSFFPRIWAAAQGLPENKGKQFRLGGGAGRVMDASPSESQMVPSKNLQGNLERLRQETQDFYKAKLATKENPNPDLSKEFKELYRGISSPKGELAAYTPSPIESWSDDPKVAKAFADWASGGGNRTVLTMKVPLSSVLFTHESVADLNEQTGNPTPEMEWVPLGGAIQGVTSKFYAFKKAK